MQQTIGKIPYRRVTEEEVRSWYEAFFSASEQAASADDVLRARDALIGRLKEFWTARSLCNYRYSQNVHDAFYQAEVDYYDAAGPHANALETKYFRCMLGSPFRAELEERLGSLLFRKFEVSVRAQSDACIADEQEENALVSSYSRLMASMLFDWEGKKVPLSILKGKLEDGDAAVRKAAADAIGNGLAAHREELDKIYDDLVHVRDRIAKKMGYKNFVELGYYRIGRTGFTRDMVEAFRRNVCTSVVPVVQRLKERLAQTLGLRRFLFSDNDVYLTGGNPAFTLTIPQAFAAAQEMYDGMDGEIGAFFRDMVATEAFDVESREGKCGGGFCDDLPSYGQEIILANFNGTTGDVDVLTHEFGHAYAMHASSAAGVDFELGIGGMETAECHSMSMEFLCHPYMEKFFFGRADEYRFKHLFDALSFLPYGCIVDEFQHFVYEHPEATPAERNAQYLALERKYRPYLTYDGIPYLSEGTRWQYQSHIYTDPFYYIDYCLAQTVALGFYMLSRKDAKNALETYKQFAKSGGSMPFSALVARAGLADPFADGTLGDLVREAERILSAYRGR